MPRNSSGSYTLVAGNPVVPDTLIETNWANPTLADLAQAVTDSLDRNGRGGMLAPLKFVDGTLAAPGIAFNSESSTGFFRPAAGILKIAIQGAEAAAFSAAGLALSGTLSVAGAVSLPGGIDTLAKLALVGAVAGPVLDVGAPLSGTAAKIRGLPGNVVGLQVISAGGPNIRIDSDHASADARNWVLQGGNSIHGELVVRVSNAKDGDPITDGRQVLQMLKEGAVAIGQAAGGNNALTVAGPVRISGHYAAEPAGITGGIFGYIHPILRCYVGDGTGYTMSFARRVGGVTTDLVGIGDGSQGQTMSIAAFTAAKAHLYLVGAGTGLSIDNGANINFIGAGANGAQINYYGTDAIELVGRNASAKYRLYTANGILRHECREDGRHYFYESAAPQVSIYQAQEALRLVGTSAYIAWFNAANTTRSGYIQITSAGVCTLNNEVAGGSTAIVALTGGISLNTSGAINLIVPAGGLITIGYARVALNSEVFAHGGVNVPLYGMVWNTNSTPNFGAGNGPAAMISGYGAVAFYVAASLRMYIGADLNVYVTSALSVPTRAANELSEWAANTTWVAQNTVGGRGSIWQTVGRAVDTEYVNTFNKPIAVGVHVNAAGIAEAYLQVRLGAGSWMNIAQWTNKGAGGSAGSVNGIIPADWSYRVLQSVGAVGIVSWNELR